MLWQLLSGTRLTAGLILLLQWPPLAGSAPNAALQDAWFVDRAEESGLRFLHFNGMTGQFLLPEITGSGAALLDYDNDGDLDVYLVQGAMLNPSKKASEAIFPWIERTPPKDRLFRNDLVRGQGPLRFTDVTERSGINSTGYGMGVATGDVNNDGWVDLYVTNLGPNLLLINRQDGTFSDATREAGVGDPAWSTSASFLDFDRDGHLDLFVTNYVEFDVSSNPQCYARSSALDYCGPDAYKPSPDRLFRNRGDGTFQDVSQQTGISREFGAGLGVVAADLNGDGWIDLYVANDGDPNQLWINQKDGTFLNEALLGGAALNRTGQPQAGMGVDAGDFDRDGDLDLFVTHLMEESNTIYVNLGGGFFEDRSIETGLHSPSLPFTAFGTAFFDYDNDGWLDLLSLNGAVRIIETGEARGNPFPLDQPNQLFHNESGRYVETTRLAGPAFALSEVSRGAAFGDLDNDGDADVVIANNSGPARLLVNQIGNRRSWLGLRLVAKTGSRDDLGARVLLELPGEPPILRRAHSDGSYCSSNDPRVLIGLDDHTAPVSIRVIWSSGKSETWRNIPINTYVAIEEGRSGQSEVSALSERRTWSH